MPRFVTRVVGGFVFATVLVAVLGAPSALSADEPQTFSVAAVRTIMDENSRAAVQSSTITCTHSIGDPHKSTHDPTKVNVVSKVVCTAPVARLVINPIDLFRNFFLVARGSNANTGQAYIQANAATTCIPAN